MDRVAFISGKESIEQHFGVLVYRKCSLVAVFLVHI